jgi:hypothetical protein
MSDPGKRQTKIADHEFSSGVGVDFGGGLECVERTGGISASTSALTSPKVVSGLCLLPS